MLVLIDLCHGSKSTSNFVYQTGFFFFLLCVCKGEKYAVLITWKTVSIAKLMYLIVQIMEGFSLNKHRLRARVLLMEILRETCGNVPRLRG